MMIWYLVIRIFLFLKLLKNMAQWLVGFPDIYELLKKTYHFLKSSLWGQFLIYVPLFFFLTFTFFIPSFTWISSINGKDASLWTAYEKTHGNYLKIVLCLFVLFAFFPFAVNLMTKQTPINLSIAHAFTTMVQLVFYIKLYDFFYED